LIVLTVARWGFYLSLLEIKQFLILLALSPMTFVWISLFIGREDMAMQ